MSQLTISAAFERADRLEALFCRNLNRTCRHGGLRHLFVAASRLGDGPAWYALILALPFLYGAAGALAAMQLLVVGMAGVAIYRYLKERLIRERPFNSFRFIVCAARPLDRYSFPSGHTLHAVSFNLVTLQHFPELAWVLAPFGILVMLSRVALGLHYPSDVVAGAAIGAALALASSSFVALLVST